MTIMFFKILRNCKQPGSPWRDGQFERHQDLVLRSFSFEGREPLRIKDGVKLSDLDIKMRIVLIEAERVWMEQFGVELEVTSTGEGIHSASSLHPYGYAVDLGTKRFLPGDIPPYEIQFTTVDRKLAQVMLDQSLPDGYDVVVEDDHIHVEWDDAKKLEVQ